VTEPAKTTIADLYLYIDELPAADGVPPRTADAYRTAIRSLQEALGIGDDTDLFELDIDRALRRFREATAGRLTRNSIDTYCNNVRRAVGRFTGRLIRSEAGRRPYRQRTISPPTTIDYTIQLRPGELVRFRLPADLTVAEAQRLAAFITSLPASTSHDAANTSPEAP